MVSRSEKNNLMSILCLASVGVIKFQDALKVGPDPEYRSRTAARVVCPQGRTPITDVMGAGLGIRLSCRLCGK